MHCIHLFLIKQLLLVNNNIIIIFWNNNYNNSDCVLVHHFFFFRTTPLIHTHSLSQLKQASRPFHSLSLSFCLLFSWMDTSGFKSDVRHWSFVCCVEGYRKEKVKLAIWCGGKEQKENWMSVILSIGQEGLAFRHYNSITM